jgi:hypothetical protein
MSDNSSFEREVGLWLANEAPVRAPAELVHETRARIAASSQVRRFPVLDWRILTLSPRLALTGGALLLAGIIAVLALSMWRPTSSIGGPPTQSPSASSGTSAPTPTNTPSLRPTSTPSWTSTTMLRPHGTHTATLLRDGHVLIAGSCSGSTKTFAEIYDPEKGSWAATSPVTVGCVSTATLLTDGRVLRAGGFGDVIDGVQNTLSTAEIYDPDSGTWTATADMVQPCGGTATLLADGTVLLAGCGADGTSAQLYDPAGGSWASTGNMVETGQVATLLGDGTVLVVGGWGSTFAQLYDPLSGSWAPTGSMLQARQGQTATLLANGNVLVAGGTGSTGFQDDALASAELYDPSAHAWTSTGAMLEAEAHEAATALGDGRVLVVGGFLGGDFGNPRAPELYEPVTETWAMLPTYPFPGTHPTITLLTDGTVLVAGGTNIGNPSAHAAIYHPGGL